MRLRGFSHALGRIPIDLLRARRLFLAAGSHLTGACERERERREGWHWFQGRPGSLKSGRQPRRWSLIPGPALGPGKGMQKSFPDIIIRPHLSPQTSWGLRKLFSFTLLNAEARYRANWPGKQNNALPQIHHLHTLATCVTMGKLPHLAEPHQGKQETWYIAGVPWCFNELKY